MAYQNVGTPRFYINLLEWYNSIGYASFPSRWHTLPVDTSNEWIHVYFDPFIIGLMSGTSDKYPHGQNFIALLGHNCVSAGGDVFLHESSDVGIVEVINKQPHHFSGYDGFSIGIFDNDVVEIMYCSYWDSNEEIWKGSRLNIGSVVLGSFYDMPNAPDLSLTMSREYGGIKEFTTHSGSSMSNTMWSKPPAWGDLGAWELGSGNPALSRSGRRTWQLKFSFMSDSDLWGIQVLDGGKWGSQAGYGWEDNDEFTADLSGEGKFHYNLLTDDSFFSRVWYKTLGGTLPFIFQPDSSNNNPDQFCIAKFKDNSLKATQSAFNVYDISLSIEEVW